jgi:hypothetical protein
MTNDDWSSGERLRCLASAAPQQYDHDNDIHVDACERIVDGYAPAAG